MQYILAAQLSLFDPYKYSGAWYEVASYKGGFYGLGQHECMDTRGLYEYDTERDRIDVATQCKHLDGSVSGVRAALTCPISKSERGMADCTMRFPTAPYVPPATYRILDTDYSTYSLVEGTNPDDSSPYVQIFSRYPRPGMRFIEAQKRILQNWGYDPDLVHISPVTFESEIENTKQF